LKLLCKSYKIIEISEKNKKERGKKEEERILDRVAQSGPVPN
jgi:hypothetical protein